MWSKESPHSLCNHLASGHEDFRFTPPIQSAPLPASSFACQHKANVADPIGTCGRYPILFLLILYFTLLRFSTSPTCSLGVYQLMARTSDVAQACSTEF